MEPRLVEAAREAVLWANWRLQLTIPSVLAVGEEFCLRLTAFGPDGLPSGDFSREIVLGASEGIEGLPRSVRLAPSAGGHLTVEGLRAVGPERAFVAARPEGCPQEVLSNPAWVMHAPPYRIFWGDLHVHTTYSNCSAWACKDPEFCYAYARDATYLDFAAAADHLRGIASDPARWGRLQELVRRYDRPGRFVPFLAFESSHKTGFGGDINAYYRDSDAPHFWLDREDMRGINPEVTLRQLWDFLDATGEAYVTVPHHTGRKRKYRSFADNVYDAEREPLFEIYSGWGSSEHRRSRFPLAGGNSDEPCYFSDALKAGCRYGVIASSDDHRTVPGGETPQGNALDAHRLVSYMQRGLAAVRAPELSRGALWDALVSRNCYGTTFSRTLVDVRIGDLSMGQSAPVARRDPLRKKRLVRVRFFSTDRGGRDVVLMRNGEEFARRTLDAHHGEVAFEDDAGLDTVAIREALFHPEAFVVYYVRVDHPQGQTQWTSPIWLDLTP